jgi:hypothetical protein
MRAAESAPTTHVSPGGMVELTAPQVLIFISTPWYVVQ